MILFFALACALSWAIWAPLWLPALGIRGLPVLPHHHALGAAGPILAALLISGREGGGAGVRELLRDLVAWRQRLGWIAVALISPFAALGVAALGLGLLHGEMPSLRGFGMSPEHPSFSLPVFWLYELVTFGYGEEAGWRGYALPRLQRRHSALTATVLLTVGWAVWHAPLFLYRPGYAGMGPAGIVGWLLSLVTGAVLLTWLYNESRGSVLVVAFFHAGIDVVFTSDVASPALTSATGAVVTVWGLAVLALAGPGDLARRERVRHA